MQSRHWQRVGLFAVVAKCATSPSSRVAPICGKCSITSGLSLKGLHASQAQNPLASSSFITLFIASAATDQTAEISGF
jgi:hypothetical protein